MNIKRKLIQVLALSAVVLLPVTISAQTNQGYSKKKVQPATTKSSKASGHKSNSKSTSSRHHSSALSSNVMSQQERDRIIQNLIANMVYVEGGTFTMGGDEDFESLHSASPIHKVSLSSFSIGKYEVSQEEWVAVLGTNPSIFKGDMKRPVENISWNDCQRFITKLNQLTGKNFRLPTEAEWEYAARGGNKSKGYRYAGSNNIDDVAWYNGSYWQSSTTPKSTYPVGAKAPNELGLFDMSGNVDEYCQDWCGHYSVDSLINPIGPSSGSYRISRGGNWFTMNWMCSVSRRGVSLPNSRGNAGGFRLVL